MALADDLLSCLALERRLYAILCRWSDSLDDASDVYELLGHLADEADRHRSRLYDVALALHLNPPPLPELELETTASLSDHAKTTLRELLSRLPHLEAELGEPYRSVVRSVREADGVQYQRLLAHYAEPRITMVPDFLPAEAPRSPLLGRMSNGVSNGVASEPRWRPSSD